MRVEVTRLTAHLPTHTASAMTNRPLTSEVRSHVPADTLLASAHAVNIASTNVIQKNRVILRGFRAPRRPRNPMAG